MILMRDSFLQQYLRYVGETEAPTFYHRWACLSMVGAFLGRQYKYSHGHFELHTNLYTMLIGEPGTRKSTAIKIAKKIIIAAGYDKISGDKTSKEKFMMDLAGLEDTELDVNGRPKGKSRGKNQTMEELLDQNLGFDELTSGEPCEMYIACDEFNDFIGLGNLEFISLLGNLWDYSGVFKNRIKTGTSVFINDPTISILGGNTSTSFANAFPPDTLGQGFFSRLLLIYGEETGRRITFPQLPSAESTNNIISALQRIKMKVSGVATLSDDAMIVLDRIYKTTPRMEDSRFISYGNRRFTHLLKLCLIISACYYSVEITYDHVIEANTILTHTESLMPKALGQFGRARNSDITHKVSSILNNADEPMSLKELWPHCISDLESIQHLADIIRNLQAADMVMIVGGQFLGKKKVVAEVNSDTVDYNYLTQEERNMK